MAIFAVIEPGGDSAGTLRASVEGKFPYDNLPVGVGTWLIAAPGTARDVATSIGVAEGQVGSAIVIEVASYWGRASPEIWSWMKRKWEATVHA